jgi:hypothetical protein
MDTMFDTFEPGTFQIPISFRRYSEASVTNCGGTEICAKKSASSSPHQSAVIYSGHIVNIHPVEVKMYKILQIGKRNFSHSHRIPILKC